MKTIKLKTYILLLSAFGLFISCSEDDEVAVAPKSHNIQIVVEAFINSQIEVIGQVGTNNANIELGFRLKPIVSTYNDSDIIVTYNGNEYIIPKGGNEVIAGTVNVEFELDPPSGAIPYDGVTKTAIIDFGGDFDVDVVDRPNDLVVLKSGSFEVSATIYAQLPPVTAGQLNFLFDWAPNHDAGNDLDLILRTSTGGYMRGAFSVSNFESLSVFDTDADNDYDVFVDPWSTVGGAMDGILFAMHPDGTLEVFTMDLAGIGSETKFVSVNKVTDIDTSEVTYTITQD